MMITSIEVNNFKLFRNLILPLRTLNIFTGLNGMGKSSLIQAMLLLRQSYQTGLLQTTGLILKGNIVELGTGKDVFYQFAGKDENVKITLSTPHQTHSWEFKYHSDSDILPLIDKQEQADPGTFNLFGKHFQYLNAEHIIPLNTYKKSEFEVVQNQHLGKYGEYAAHFLSVYGLDPVKHENLIHPRAKSNRLNHNVEAWMNEVSPGIKINVEDVKGLDLVKLGYLYETESGYTDEYKPINVGFGITYALPVIIALLTADGNKMTIIENPESHVHPKGQAKIGELAAISASNGCQIFIETHSDHVLNGVRVAVKNRRINKENIGINYFARISNHEGYESDVKTILLDEKGELSEYPNGLLDEWSNQLFKLI